MNTKRIFTWGAFVIIIGLIIWGMIAAANKAKMEKNGLIPVDEVTSDDWTRGNASSTATLIEYSDFQCPACGAYFPLVEEVYAKNSGSFRFVYRHFPLLQHPNALPAAQAAEAAGMQGKFWEMYNQLFTKQLSWATSTDPKAVFAEYAKTLDLDTVKFSSDYELQSIKDKINASVRRGGKIGVNSTPTFYLNGKKIQPQSYEEFKNLIIGTSTVTMATTTATSTNP
jgi:protein-disulfide isomerase